MIQNNTTLILGAGTSIDYGYPSGRDLLIHICKELQTTGEFYTTLYKLGISENKIKEFRDELYFSQQSSVDAFLEHRQEFIDVGKLAIARALIPFENDKLLFSKEKYRWYEYLYSKLNADFIDFRTNKLYIVTFNYDRSLEHYLFTALKSSHGKSDDECANILGYIPIIHIHGQLSYLPWQCDIDKPSRPYSEIISDIEEIRVAADQLKIISEGNINTEELQQAVRLMYESSYIYILGFGYHDENLKKLQFGHFKSRHVRGSCYGLGDADTTAINSRWGIRFPDQTKGDILFFLRNHIHFV